jgi:hypothetical protein
MGISRRSARRTPPGEIRVALIGGSAAYEAATKHEDTMAMAIVSQLQENGRPLSQEYSVVNLAQPRVSADSYVGTLRAYAFLEPDAVAVVDGYDAIAGLPPHAREQSAVFRTAGYLPILPARLLGRPAWLSDPDGGILDMLQDGRTDPADVGCDGASKAYCTAMADTVRFVLQRGLPVVRRVAAVRQYAPCRSTAVARCIPEQDVRFGPAFPVSRSRNRDQSDSSRGIAGRHSSYGRR